MPDPIGGVSAAQPSDSASASQSSAFDRLGKQDFLKLLVAQLRNQDPMKPMEDKEFIAQLAQFSSLEALQNLDKRLEAFGTAQLLGQATSLIGKRVTATLADQSVLSGVVSEARLVGGQPRLVVNGQQIGLDVVTAVASQ